MAIKFALKDNAPKSTARDKSAEKEPAELPASNSGDAPDIDLFEAKPADQKRKKKKW